MKQQVKNLQIHWHQIWSLVALDVAIIISWIAYHEYQPNLVKQFGFAKYQLVLAIVQACILLITPPLAGMVADTMRKKNGSRLPVINTGISVVSMVFMAVAFTILAEPSGAIRWVFPILIVLWLISMNIFHSPAISMVELFVPVERLPEVMAIFVIMTNLGYAIEPSVEDLINLFGAPLTFGVGGILVFSTGWFFQRSSKNLAVIQEDVPGIKVEKSNYLLVLGVGVALGGVTALLFDIFPGVLEKKIDFLHDNHFKGNYFVSLLVAFSALISYPIGRWVQKFGVYKATVGAYIAIGIALGGIFLVPVPSLVLLLCVVYIVGFSVVCVSALPIAFMNLGEKNKVLGIGLFFTGVEFFNSLVEVLQTGKVIH